MKKYLYSFLSFLILGLAGLIFMICRLRGAEEVEFAALIIGLSLIGNLIRIRKKDTDIDYKLLYKIYSTTLYLDAIVLGFISYWVRGDGLTGTSFSLFFFLLFFLLGITGLVFYFIDRIKKEKQIY